MDIKLKFKLPKKFNIPIIVGALLILVILFEVYLGYFQVYRKLDPQADFGGSSGIIRINRTGFNEISDYLDSLYQFEHQIPDLVDTNPFKY